jgi:hypothetical protein
MKRFLLSLTCFLAMILGVSAQSIDNSFFDKVTYVGALGSSDWTKGWTNWDPVNTNYPATTNTKGNGQFSRSTGTHITTNQTWSGVIKLDGWVYVDENAALTIQPGTIVRGTEKSGLFIERGAKIYALGTEFSPIVFTSNQGVGLRSQSNWAGIVICGKAINNLPGGEGIAEGGIDSPYGGTDTHDNSGIFQYVRIEFPGYEVATGKEINGLTLCSVGDGTTIDHVQVSYSGDDGFEWFGGSVNAKYIISYKTEDDDFDTDNGFVGMIQYGIISRDPDIVDTDTANAFESDNDATGSTSAPFTHAIFSNISAFGPIASASTATLAKNHEEGAALRIRRSSKLQIYNSLFMGWGRGVRLESDNTLTSAKNGEMVIKNTIIAGIRNDKYKVDGTVMDVATLEAWYLAADKENKMLATNEEVTINAPFNYSALNFIPKAGSPVFNASYWAGAVTSDVPSINNNFFDKVSYCGALVSSNDWTKGWTEWNPIDKVYPDATVTKGNGQFSRSTGLHITSSEEWSGVIKLDGWVYVDAGATLFIKEGTIIRGTEKSGVFIERGAKISAIGTSNSPIVFTSNQGAGLRSQSNWAGVVICGKAPNNLPGGEGIAEGGIDSPYGGSDPHDNSGTMKFVRIEFPGYEVATGKEINGLTLCSVGDATTIDHIQVSYSGDDAYEWFGGTVNAKYLIAYKTEDDDFDTDNGFVGMIQYGIISRDPDIVDTDTANAFESDNDATGSTSAPFTQAVFSNISAFGPFATATEPATLAKNHTEGAALRIRRSSKLQIYNSVFLGWGRGVRLESDNTLTYAKNGELNINNTIIAGVRTDKYKLDGTVMDVAGLEAWYLATDKKNKMLANNADVKIADAYNYAALNFTPLAGSPVYNASYWASSVVTEGPSIKNAFFEQVSFVGAFAENDHWTSGWTNWDPVNTAYPATTKTKGNGQFSRSTGTHITSNESWSGVIKLDGWVYVDAGATLSIDAGTIIRGTEKSGIFIERGAKINAIGTQSSPIIFTSNQGVGLRSQSNWAGIVICGKAPNNLPGGEGIAEGGIDSPYGGSEPHDNSGVMRYVRIEFPGYEVATGKEINGLTLCSVGDATTLEYIQVSYSGDDGFEWFGGTVNAKYIISYKTEDDDFDTDNGFVGLVQYGIISRDPDIVDTDTANAFESDNDATGSTSEPFTQAVFSNISAFGPFASASTATLAKNHEEGAALRIRRSSKLQIYNSLFMGWGRGVRLESDNTLTYAKNGEMNINNTIIAGTRNDKYKLDGNVMDVAGLEAWYLTEDKENKMVASNAEVNIADAFNEAALNFAPLSGSPVLNASYWYVKPNSVTHIGNATALKNYPNPFVGSTNISVNVVSDSKLKVVVFNSMGVKVSQLYNGTVNAGNHEFIFDATSLPKGIYVGVVTVDQSTSTIKMVAR